MATTTTFSDKFAGFLRKTATGIEKLQIQLTLGEAEADDKFEEVKKSFHRFITNSKAKIGTSSRASFKEFRSELEDLQVQLALGKAETKEVFAAQKKKITNAMNKLEGKLKRKYKRSGVEEELLHEMEAARIKLEMLQVQYELGKKEAKEEFEKKKQDLKAIIEKSRTKISKKEFSENRQRHYAEVKEAYRNLKKAYVKA